MSTPLLEERDNGTYYVGPLAPAKAYLRAWYGDRLRERTLEDGVVTVGEHQPGDDQPSQWGASESGDWDEAWRYLAGTDFGPLDEEYDEKRLRQLLSEYGEV